MSLFRKKGGGFLNGVAGTIDSIGFGEKSWEGKNGEYRTVSMELLVTPDGGEQVQQFLPAGFLYEDHSISDDGKTIEGGEGDVIGEDTEAALFLQSILDADPSLEEKVTGRNFEGWEGLRVTFKKEVNKARQMAAGVKKLGKKAAASASEEDIMKAGRRQDKNDKTKFYNHDLLLVSEVLDAEAKPAAKGKAAKAAPAAAATKKAAKKGEDFEAADAFLIELLADAKDKTVNVSSINSLVVRKALADDVEDDVRDSYRKLYADGDYLGRENGWKVEGEGKKQTVSLVKGKK